MVSSPKSIGMRWFLPRPMCVVALVDRPVGAEARTGHHHQPADHRVLMEGGVDDLGLAADDLRLGGIGAAGGRLGGRCRPCAHGARGRLAASKCTRVGVLASRTASAALICWAGTVGISGRADGRGRARRGGRCRGVPWPARRPAFGSDVGALADGDLARAVVAAGGVQRVAQRAQDAVGYRARRPCAPVAACGLLSSFMLLSLLPAGCEPIKSVRSQTSCVPCPAR